MQRQRVNSTNLVSVGYDSASQILEIEFKDRAVYQYLGVPPGEYTALMGASSHGSYLERRIKGRYRYSRV